MALAIVIKEASEIVSLVLVATTLLTIYREARLPEEKKSIWGGFGLALVFMLISSLATVLEAFFLPVVFNAIEHVTNLVTAMFFAWFVWRRVNAPTKNIYDL